VEKYVTEGRGTHGYTISRVRFARQLHKAREAHASVKTYCFSTLPTVTQPHQHITVTHKMSVLFSFLLAYCDVDLH
jgi:hypothetical protein